MTEIKFRAWDKVKKSLLRVEIIDYPEWSVSCEDGSTERNSFKNERTDRHVLMQYTGLQDKHGKDIYEGDLIKITDPFINQEAIGVAEIVFSHEYVGGWVAESAGQHLNVGTRTHMINVVGNKYEHKHLLEDDENE